MCSLRFYCQRFTYWKNSKTIIFTYYVRNKLKLSKKLNILEYYSISKTWVKIFRGKHRNIKLQLQDIKDQNRQYCSSTEKESISLICTWGLWLEALDKVLPRGKLGPLQILCLLCNQDQSAPFPVRIPLLGTRRGQSAGHAGWEYRHGFFVFVFVTENPETSRLRFVVCLLGLLHVSIFSNDRICMTSKSKFNIASLAESLPKIEIFDWLLL